MTVPWGGAKKTAGGKQKFFWGTSGYLWVGWVMLNALQTVGAKSTVAHMIIGWAGNKGGNYKGLTLMVERVIV